MRLVEYTVVSSLVGVMGPNLILFSAVPRVGASFVALSLAFPPLFTYVGAIALRMERYRHSRAIGVVLALAGAAFLAAIRLSAPDANVFWLAATISVPVILAVGNIYRTRRWPKGAKPHELAPAMLISSSILLVSLGLLADLPLHVSLHQTEPILLIVAQTMVFSFQYLLFFKLQALGGPVYLSLLGSVAAVVGIPMAVFLQNEAPLEGLSIGAVLIASGIFLVAWGGVGTRKKRASNNFDDQSWKGQRSTWSPPAPRHAS
jgi:drug/metabolite transporter (DMT)-like permease